MYDKYETLKKIKAIRVGHIFEIEWEIGSTIYCERVHSGWKVIEHHTVYNEWEKKTPTFVSKIADADVGRSVCVIDHGMKFDPKKFK